jgi:hypothetical protein
MFRKTALTSLVLAVLGLLGVPVGALALSGGPQWTVTSVSRPTNFCPAGASACEAQSGKDSYLVTVTNTGSAPSDGSPIMITDELPKGLTLDHTGASGESKLIDEETLAPYSEQPTKLACLLRSCTYTGIVAPDETLTLTFPMDVSKSAAPLETNVVRVSGGGAPDAAVETPTMISSYEASFGISPGGARTALSTTQAGSHPDLTTSIAFNTVNTAGSTAGEVKDTTDDLPPGFAGDLVNTPSCAPGVFVLEACPIDTQIGVTTLAFELQGDGTITRIDPVYNISPNQGDLAKLGFDAIQGRPTEAEVSLRPSDYGLRTTFANIPESQIELDKVSLTIWGVPAASIHDPLRWVSHGESAGKFGASSGSAQPAPFFTNPTACGGEPLDVVFSVTSWEHPNESESPTSTSMKFGPIVGCDRLVMEPSLTAEPTSDAASSATDLDVDTRIPQTYGNAEGLATSTLKKEVVTLPEGMTVNPSAGAGLLSCTEAQYAEEGAQYVGGRGCPNESRLASVKIVTPSLGEEVTGSLFLAEPAPLGEAHKNPFGSLLALYLVARIPGRGLLIKTPGEVQPNLETGRLTTTFDDLPPLPFSLATFSFDQGAEKPIVTPPACGDYTMQAQLTPYSNPEGVPLESLTPPFTISSGVGGTPCPSGGVPPFKPTIDAGTLNNDAGAYSPFDLRIVRKDGEQEITGFSSQLPPGLTGNLTGLQQCSETDIQHAHEQSGEGAEGDSACPPGSEIGHTIAEAGVGSVLAQTPGKLYLGEQFEGAPFSIVSVTSTKVGPFDLGTVVVHLPLDINPETAQVSIPSGPADQIPHIIKGIVIHLRDIRVYISHPDFMLNPTNCAAQTLGATVIGGGANPTNPAGYDPVTVTNPFEAANCASLVFQPKLSASTESKDNFNDNGVSLTVRLAANQGPNSTTGVASEANIAKVKVELPKALPSRLTTLQKACTAAQFNANPAGCPAASMIGYATVHTPILPVPLTGPAIFVSHGGEAFPSLILVLQGYGVKIDLVGATFISHAGITSSTFKTVPDQPFSTFELTLPTGKYSALAANANLCTVKGGLKMPTEFTAQNGAVIHQNTAIAVSGCPKAKTAAQLRAEKLNAALRACHKKAKVKRAACEKAARKRYGPVKPKKKRK